MQSVEYDDFTYLAVHNNGGMNQQNDVTYDLQSTNSKNLVTWNIVIKYLQVLSIHSQQWFDQEFVVNEKKIRIEILYLMYITYVSFCPRDLLKLHVLNEYHHKIVWWDPTLLEA